MDRYDLVPDKSVGDVILVLLVLFIFICVFVVIYLIERKKRKIRIELLFKPFIRRYNIDQFQAALLYEVAKIKKFMSISTFFDDEYYFDSIVKDFLLKKRRRGYTKKMLENEETELNVIKQKIPFTHKKPHSSKDARGGRVVKVQIRGLGFFTGKIIHNDHEGIVIKLHHFEEIKQTVNKKAEVILYYWDAIENFEIHTHVKKFSKGAEHYLLVSHDNAMLRGSHPGGMGIDTDITTYFTHIFELPEGHDIKQHILNGQIKSLSIVGAEIFTRFKVDKGGLYLFEFHAPGKRRNRDRYRFTARVEDYERSTNGRRLYVTFLDMNERSRRYIHQFVLNKMNALALEGRESNQ